MIQSLCRSCLHVRVVTSGTGSQFMLCQLSQRDRRFAKYPAQPVFRCVGYQYGVEKHNNHSDDESENNAVSDVPSRTHFEQAYAGQAPWDIGKPQPALTAVADRITGSILDAGCGTGENALFFAQRGLKVTGVDYLAEPIERAQRKAAERGVKATFLVLDALALADIPETFDAAIDSGLFHVFNDDDRRRYVAGLASVLNPGGRLYLICFSDAEPGTAGPRRISEPELRAAFAADWQIESIEPTRFEIRSDLKELTFSPGGPKAWFVVARRTA